MKLRLTAAAPIRVGGREQQVNKLEFVRYRNQFHAVSEWRLGSRLLQKSARTLDDWDKEVLRLGQKADLTNFLRNEDLLDDDTVEEISRYSVSYDLDRANMFQPQARDGFGDLLVPGSAIKGAIRAAVMWAQVDEEGANNFVGNSQSRSPHGYANELNEEALQDYNLPGAQTPAHRDLLRAVKVSDAYGALRSRVKGVLIQSYTESPRGRTATSKIEKPIPVECIVPESWAEFDLKVEEKIIRDFQRHLRDGDLPLPFTDEKSLLGLVRSFYEEAWRFERRYYGVEEDQIEEPEEFPSQKEWITQKYGELSRSARKAYKDKYSEALKDFKEKREREEELSQAETFPAIQDGDKMPLQEIREFYTGSSPGFRLGWGSGLMSTTVNLRLDKHNRGKVLNVIRRRPYLQPVPREGPKSRKLVEEERVPRWPMGWARLEEVTDGADAAS